MNSSDLLPTSHLPTSWTYLGPGERHSTVSHFIGGFQGDNDSELLVWRGVSVVYAIGPDGNVYTDDETLAEAEADESWSIGEGADFEGYNDQSPDDEYNYLIEHIDSNGELADSWLCEDFDCLKTTIKNIIRKEAHTPPHRIRSAVEKLKTVFGL